MSGTASTHTVSGRKSSLEPTVLVILISEEDIVDHGLQLRCIGGTYGGNRKPTPFLCLVLKLLQIQPEKRVIYAYIENPHHK